MDTYVSFPTNPQTPQDVSKPHELRLTSTHDTYVWPTDPQFVPIRAPARVVHECLVNLRDYPRWTRCEFAKEPRAEVNRDIHWTYRRPDMPGLDMITTEHCYRTKYPVFVFGNSTWISSRIYVVKESETHPGECELLAYFALSGFISIGFGPSFLSWLGEFSDEQTKDLVKYCEKP